MLLHLLALTVAHPAPNLVGLNDPARVDGVRRPEPVHWRLEFAKTVKALNATNVGARNKTWRASIEASDLVVLPPSSMSPGTITLPIDVRGESADTLSAPFRERLEVTVVVPASRLEPVPKLSLELRSGERPTVRNWVLRADGPLHGLGVRPAAGAALRNGKQVDPPSFELSANGGKLWQPELQQVGMKADLRLRAVGVESLGLGKTTGTILLFSPWLKKPVTIDYEVHRRAAWLWFWAVALAGVLLGLLVRLGLVTYAARRRPMEIIRHQQRYAQALAQEVADEELRTKIEGLVQRAEKLLTGRFKVDELKARADCMPGELKALFSDYEARRKAAQDRLSIWKKTLAAPALSLPPGVRRTLTAEDVSALEGLAEARKVTQLCRALDDSLERVQVRLRKEVDEWTDYAEGGMHDARSLLSKEGRARALRDFEAAKGRHQDVDAWLDGIGRAFLSLRDRASEAERGLADRVEGALRSLPELQPRLEEILAASTSKGLPTSRLFAASKGSSEALRVILGHYRVEDAEAARAGFEEADWGDFERGLKPADVVPESRRPSWTPMRAAAPAFPTPDTEGSTPSPTQIPGEGSPNPPLAPLLGPSAWFTETLSTALTLALFAAWTTLSGNTGALYGTWTELFGLLMAGFGTEFSLATLVERIRESTAS